MSRGHRNSASTGLRRERLPSPLEFYESRGVCLRGTGEWRTALCPFHPDTRPSFSVNAVSGGFVCHACGQRGGDVITFVQLRDGLGFVAAAKQLGAWESDPALRREAHGI